jgi:hypothetical protein
VSSVVRCLPSQQERSNTLTSRKKRVAKRGAYALTRPKAGAPRLKYLVTNVTAAEKRSIDEYCQSRGISVSAFLAGLILKEVQKAPNSRDKDEEVTVTLRLSRQDLDKLSILGRLQQKTMADLLHDGLKPSLSKRKGPSHVEWESLRCWLSKDEHKAIKKYLDKNHLSARSYLALLALKAVGGEADA